MSRLAMLAATAVRAAMGGGAAPPASRPSVAPAAMKPRLPVPQASDVESPGKDR